MQTRSRRAPVARKVTLKKSAPPAAQVVRGDVFDAKCPSRAILRDVTSRWGLLILIALRSGTLRFSALRRKIGGVSERMLSQTLQALEGDGFVCRQSLPVVPPHVEYSLTQTGEDVAAHVAVLVEWVELHYGAVNPRVPT